MLDELHYAIADYLGGIITLLDFNEWFVPNYWDVHLWGSKTMCDLTYAVDLFLAEYTGGYRTEESLRGCLRDLIPAGVRPE
jgi:hypothetical protein